MLQLGRCRFNHLHAQFFLSNLESLRDRSTITHFRFRDGQEHSVLTVLLLHMMLFQDLWIIGNSFALEECYMERILILRELSLVHGLEQPMDSMISLVNTSIFSKVETRLQIQGLNCIKKYNTYFDPFYLFQQPKYQNNYKYIPNKDRHPLLLFQLVDILLLKFCNFNYI